MLGDGAAVGFVMPSQPLACIPSVTLASQRSVFFIGRRLGEDVYSCPSFKCSFISFNFPCVSSSYFLQPCIKCFSFFGSSSSYLRSSENQNVAVATLRVHFKDVKDWRIFTFYWSYFSCSSDVRYEFLCRMHLIDAASQQELTLNSSTEIEKSAVGKY